MKIDTTHYVGVHGRHPRGKGRWAFDVMRGREETNTYFVGGFMTYASASRKAVEWFRAAYHGDPRYSLRVAS